MPDDNFVKFAAAFDLAEYELVGFVAFKFVLVMLGMLQMPFFRVTILTEQLYENVGISASAKMIASFHRDQIITVARQQLQVCDEHFVPKIGRPTSPNVPKWTQVWAKINAPISGRFQMPLLSFARLKMTHHFTTAYTNQRTGRFICRPCTILLKINYQKCKTTNHRLLAWSTV
ncbi:hypothetical protein T4D_8414 [Trichinella pseudospiralis]|uniref:Uncharacterized protein n=1 Tax=Trichinella pseudospiralis TaxID=6337 RepID=A0A0V1F896_TRIPS|nr:hypothetical protein T4D_8414 [Trichinella pseudospiralis]